MRDQLNHPLAGLISEHHREHFYTQEEYERSRELRGERAATKLTRMVNLMKETLPKVADAELRGKLSGLVDEITRSSLRYIDERIELVKVANQPYRDNEAIMSVDRSRRSAHVRLVDAIRIACRNFVQNVEGFHVDEDMTDLIGDSTNADVRDRVAHAAIDLVWELLNQEEDAARIANK